jgi:protein-S-isoprenylcysteine O-methyltransferase Ste14
MKRDHVIGLVSALSGLFTLLLCFFTRTTLPIPKGLAMTLGAALYLLGMALFFWAIRYLRESFLGLMEPASNHFVRIGPYRWVRYPPHLSRIITLLGIGIALHSLWGMVSIFLVFLPAMLYRTLLEEKARYRKFGNAWIADNHHTKFIIPLVW